MRLIKKVAPAVALTLSPLFLISISVFGQEGERDAFASKSSVRTSRAIRETLDLFDLVPVTNPIMNAEFAASAQAPPEFDRDDAFERIEYLRDRFGKDRIAAEVRLKLIRNEYLRREEERIALDNSTSPTASSWRSLGPTNAAGMIKAIAVHPTQNGTIYAGGENGGVWKTTNGGGSWFPLSDSLPFLSVDSMAISQSSPNIVYVGTGSVHQGGVGILRSTDGGVTWQFPTNVPNGRIYRMSLHPQNPDELVIGTNLGIHRSVDGGSTWTRPLTNKMVFDVVRDPTNPLVLFAGASDDNYNTPPKHHIYKSIDGGMTWSERSNGLPTGEIDSITQQVRIAIAPSNPQILYAALVTSQANGSRVFKSTDGGTSWVDLPGISASPDSNVRNFLGGQTFRNITITVAPDNPNVVIAGGLIMVRTTDGGQTWSNILITTPNRIHADQVDMAWEGSKLYIASDGGMFLTSDLGTTGSEINANLAIRQYYSLTHSPSGRILAGAQDNGTDRSQLDGTQNWNSIFNGDGFDAAVHPTNPSIAYVTRQAGEIWKTQNAEVATPTFSPITPPYPPSEPRGFGVFLKMDNVDPNIIYAGSKRVASFTFFSGLNNIWKTTNGGASWTALPNTTTDGTPWNTYDVGGFAVAVNDRNVLYAAKYDRVYMSINGGTTWISSAVPRVQGCFKNVATDVEAGATNSNVLYLANRCALAGSPGSFYISNDRGATWTEKRNGLPNNPLFNIDRVIVDPNAPESLYLATDFGVYYSVDHGENWAVLGNGLPATIVSDIAITNIGRKLRAATYGRGVWEYQLPSPPVSVGGRVTTPAGLGLRNAIVAMTDAAGLRRTTTTSSFGIYSFSGVVPGDNYTLSVASKRYRFAPRILLINDALSNIDFVGLE